MKVNCQSRQYRRLCVRNQVGQGLAESAAAATIIMALMVAGVLLIMTTGQLIYYKIKLCSIAEAAAEYAADARYWLGAQRPYYTVASVQTQTGNMAKALLKLEGFDTSSVTCTVDQTSDKVVSVTLKVDKLGLLTGGFLPSTTAVAETASQPYPNDRPNGLLGVTVCKQPSGCGGIYLPTYGAGARASGPSSYPSSALPYWEGAGYTKAPLVGPFQNGDQGGPFKSY